MTKSERLEWVQGAVIYRTMFGTKEEGDEFEKLMHDFIDKGLKFEQGENERWLYARAGDVLELKGLKKCSNGWFPYYDIQTFRYIGTEGYMQRSEFKFKSTGKDKVNVEIRDNKAYIDKGNFCPEGQLLLSCTGTIGDTFTAPEDLYATPSLKALSGKYDIFAPEFLEMWVARNKYALKNSVATAYVPSLNKKAFDKLLVPLPCKYDQLQTYNRYKMIASIVDSLNN